MTRMLKFIHNWEFDQMLTGIIGVVAVLIAVSDFIGLFSLAADTLLQMMIVGVGLLLATSVAQAVRQKEEYTVLQEMLAAETNVLTGRQVFLDRLAQGMQTARRFVKDTSCGSCIYDRADELNHRYYQVRKDRIARKEIKYMRLEIVYDKETLRRVIWKLLMFADKYFFLRHYHCPPKAIPMLQVISIDDELFYVGGFSSSEPSVDYQVAVIRSKRLAALLKDYWQTLWMHGVPLNKGSQIDWEELGRIANRLNMTDAEFEQMADEIRREFDGLR